jgi:two-component system NtrC family response regulator
MVLEVGAEVNGVTDSQGSENWHRPERLRHGSDASSGPDNPSVTSVLVVDDDEAVRSSVADILRSAGHTAIQVADGEAALRVLRTLRFDAMVLDLRMPGLDGFALLAALAQAPPVVTVSAFHVNTVACERVRSQIVRHLPKPVHPQVLLDAVAHATRRTRP